MRNSEHFGGQCGSIVIEISISTSILFLLRIGIGDTFEPSMSIGIEYRRNGNTFENFI